MRPRRRVTRPPARSTSCCARLAGTSWRSPTMSWPGTASALADGAARAKAIATAAPSRAARIGLTAPLDVPQAAHRERPHDVADPVHQRPDPGEDEQRVRLVDEELAARVEGQNDHQRAGHDAQDLHGSTLGDREGADDPPKADE